MDNIKLYEIETEYVDYMTQFAPHLFHNKQPGQHNERKYIGIVLEIDGYNYFAPLSSFKEKHTKMHESLDFIKVKTYAVINLNNMFPTPLNLCSYVDINNEKDVNYKKLLLAEYRFIKSIQDKIRKNALNLYKHKLQNGNSTPLSRRCNDFRLLEEAYNKYIDRQG